MGIFPTSTTQQKVIDNYWAPEMTPLAPLLVYLTLVAISSRNCVSIPSNQQVVVDASAQLSESVTKFKEFLEPFATILPTNDQMKDIPSPFNPFTNWKFPWTFLIFLTIFGQF